MWRRTWRMTGRRMGPIITNCSAYGYSSIMYFLFVKHHTTQGGTQGATGVVEYTHLLLGSRRDDKHCESQPWWKYGPVVEAQKQTKWAAGGSAVSLWCHSSCSSKNMARSSCPSSQRKLQPQQGRRKDGWSLQTASADVFAHGLFSGLERAYKTQLKQIRTMTVARKQTGCKTINKQ